MNTPDCIEWRDEIKNNESINPSGVDQDFVYILGGNKVVKIDYKLKNTFPQNSCVSSCSLYNKNNEGTISVFGWWVTNYRHCYVADAHVVVFNNNGNIVETTNISTVGNFIPSPFVKRSVSENIESKEMTRSIIWYKSISCPVLYRSPNLKDDYDTLTFYNSCSMIVTIKGDYSSSTLSYNIENNWPISKCYNIQELSLLQSHYIWLVDSIRTNEDSVITKYEIIKDNGFFNNLAKMLEWADPIVFKKATNQRNNNLLEDIVDSSKIELYTGSRAQSYLYQLFKYSSDVDKVRFVEKDGIITSEESTMIVPYTRIKEYGNKFTFEHNRVLYINDYFLVTKMGLYSNIVGRVIPTLSGCEENDICMKIDRNHGKFQHQFVTNILASTYPDGDPRNDFSNEHDEEARRMLRLGRTMILTENNSSNKLN